MKTTKPVPSPAAALPLVVAEDKAKASIEAARTKMITDQRTRAGELLSKATTREEILSAVQHAGAEIAAAELPENRMDYQPPRSVNETAHLANLDILTGELQVSERQRQAEIIARQEDDMKRRNSEVDFIRNEMKLTHATRFYSSGE